MRSRLTFSSSLVLLLCLASPCVRACNVPVFRYALERWNKRNVEDVYSLYVFHDGPLSEELRKNLDDFDAILEDPKQLVNLLSYRVDTSKKMADEAIARIYEQEKAKAATIKGPWMVLRFPDTWGMDRSLYVGPFDRSALQGWLDSPLRRTIARQILQGQSAVFLFLESGDAKQDAETLTRIRKKLDDAEKLLTLPQLTDAPKDKLLREDIPLKISFAIVRLSRSDASEKHLIDMLQGMDHEQLIEKRKTDAVLIPFYGRGIAMVNECLIGKGITNDNIDALVRFLVGACSCEVRRLNPGIEILTSVNWDGPPTPEPVVDSPISASCAESLPVEPRDDPPVELKASPSSVMGNLMWTLGAGAAAVMLVSLVLVSFGWKQKRS